MLKKILLGLLAVLLVAVILTYVSYRNFSSDYTQELTKRSQVAQTDSGPIEYIQRGTGGPYVLFLHGTPGGYDQSPADASYRLIAPSRPGYLRTPIDAGRTPEEQAKAYVALLDALGIEEKIFVMGASGGGPSAYAFAAAYPERTLGLVQIESLSHPMSETAEEMPSFMKDDFQSWLMMSLLTLQGPEGVVAMLIPDPANQQRILQNEDKVAGFMNMMWSTWPPSRRNAGTDNDFAQFASMSLPLASITVPTLAIHGDADTSVPLAQSQYAAEQIENFTLHVIEGADHMMPVTHEEEMGEVIEQFVVNIMSRDQ